MSDYVNYTDTIRCKNGWVFETFSKDHLQGRPEDAVRFINLCLSKSPEGTLPNWTDFDFYDFVGFHGRLIVQKIQHDPFEVTYTLWGTTVTDAYNKDYTNKTLKLTNIDHHMDEEAHMIRLCQNRLLGRSKGPLIWENKEHVIIEWLDIPFSSDNKTVNYVVSYLLSSSIKL